MPKLVRLYIFQVLIGFGLSAIFVGLLLYLNVANLWHLVSTTSGGMVAVVMLVIFNGIVFAGVQFSITIMHMAGDDKPGGGKTQKSLAMQARLTPAKVKATSPR